MRLAGSLLSLVATSVLAVGCSSAGDAGDSTGHGPSGSGSTGLDTTTTGASAGSTTSGVTTSGSGNTTSTTTGGTTGATATAGATTGATTTSGATTGGTTGATQGTSGGVTSSSTSTSTSTTGATTTSGTGTTGTTNTGTTGTGNTTGTTTGGTSTGTTGARSTTGTTTGGATTGTTGARSTTGTTGTATTGTTGGTGTGDIYISPTGVDTNTGTMASPFLTLRKAETVVTAGGTIWVMAGTFNYTTTMTLDKSGTSAAPIKVWAVAGARPVFDFTGQSRGSSSRGIDITADYWHVRGVEVANAGDNGIAISGAHNTIENVVLHNNEDTGLQITAPTGSDASKAAYNTILNCDSYENFDHATGGENADGFAAKLRIGAGNVFRGCRAWNNADDGWDLFASNDVVTIDNCWAFLNGKPAGGGNPAGDGNGFKLGGAPSASDPDQGGAVHIVTNDTSFENLACGFVRNNNPDVPMLSNCAVHANASGKDYCQVTCNPSTTISTTGAAAKAIARNADGSLPAIK